MQCTNCTYFFSYSQFPSKYMLFICFASVGKSYKRIYPKRKPKVCEKFAQNLILPFLQEFNSIVKTVNDVHTTKSKRLKVLAHFRFNELVGFFTDLMSHWRHSKTCITKRLYLNCASTV